SREHLRMTDRGLRLGVRKLCSTRASSYRRFEDRGGLLRHVEHHVMTAGERVGGPGRIVLESLVDRLERAWARTLGRIDVAALADVAMPAGEREPLGETADRKRGRQRIDARGIASVDVEVAGRRRRYGEAA